MLRRVFNRRYFCVLLLLVIGFLEFGEHISELRVERVVFSDLNVCVYGRDVLDRIILGRLYGLKRQVCARIVGVCGLWCMVGSFGRWSLRTLAHC
jgi:hypothetical protein